MLSNRLGFKVSVFGQNEQIVVTVDQIGQILACLYRRVEPPDEEQQQRAKLGNAACLKRDLSMVSK